MTGKPAALAAGIAAAAVALAAVSVLEDRILERWYLHRLEAGGWEAKLAAIRWLGARGGERSFLALGELNVAVYPSLLLHAGQGDEAPEPAARGSMAEIELRMGIEERRMMMPGEDAEWSVMHRLGKARTAAVIARVLAGNSGSRRLVATYARLALQDPELGMGEAELDLAARRLREALADRDAIVRAGAAYGLTHAGRRARPAMAAIEALEGDPEFLVREAAKYAFARLAGLGEEREEAP